MAPITIHGNTWDPDDPQGGPQPAPDAQNTNYILIQVQETLQPNHFDDLQDAGVEIRLFVDIDVYLAYYPPSDLQVLRSKPYLRHVDIYHPFFAIEKNLKDPPTRHPDDDDDADGPPLADKDATKGRIQVQIEVHEGCDVGQLRDRLESRQLIEPRDDDPESAEESTITTVNVNRIGAIAEEDEVYLITRHVEAVPAIDVARGIVGLPCNAMALAPVVQQSIFDGTGETINIADSGFNMGSILNPNGVAFEAKGATPKAIRCITSSYLDPRDRSGHGTSVAGCAVGNGSSANQAGPLADSPGQVRGSAPGAEFTVIQIASQWDAILHKYSLLGSKPFAAYVNDAYVIDGSRVSNHSYNPPVDSAHPQRPYTAQNKSMDLYSRRKQDLVICWSAGNSGVTADGLDNTIGSGACAKNNIAVGATKNLRPVNSADEYDRNGDWMNPSERATFSSCGPTYEGRYKPDVCAPGDVILVAYSTATWNAPPAPNPLPPYTWDSGTSFAAPLVAGCAAVLRQALRRRNVATPSAALIKALLVNGADDIMRAADGPIQIPNNKQGFGRVNIGSSLEMVLVETALPQPPSPSAGFIDAGPSNTQYPPLQFSTNRNATLVVNVPGPDIVLSAPAISTPRTLKVTLTWLDSPGGNLQDRLGLWVSVNPGGGGAASWAYGNDSNVVRTGSFDSTRLDPRNNVQQVMWEDIPPGTATIGIVYDSTTKQIRNVPYALAWSIQ